MPSRITNTRNILSVLAGLLLLFNGVGALFGGWNLMAHTDGSSLELSPAWLEHAPFKNYFIPGLILFVMNGLLSIATLAALLSRMNKHELLIMLQGVILTGWILMQVLFIRTFHFFHLIFGSVGLVLFLVGYLLRRIQAR